MVTYAYPKAGNVFVLTEEGSKIGRIKAKFTEECKRLQYQHSAPKAWLDKGWIVEKEDNNGVKNG